MEDNTPNDITKLHQSLVEQLKSRDLIRTTRIEEAFRAIPRHLFVPNEPLEKAYSDAPIATKVQDDIPISSCSQPAITAMMLELLDLHLGQRVLEIGAGTGYAAALIGHIVGASGQVVTLDIDEDIVQDARAHLQAAGVENVQAYCVDGALGWQEAAPYDRIILTVGTSDIAPAWYEQLWVGGRLVLPLWLLPFRSLVPAIAMTTEQFLLAFDRTATGLESVAIQPCGFIPLRGTLAVASADAIPLGPQPGSSALFSRPIDAAVAFNALRSSLQIELTNVYMNFLELWGLRLWLAFSQTDFSELYTTEEVAQEQQLPTLLKVSKDLIVTMGLYEQDTWSLLMVEEDTSPSKDIQRPFRLTIQRFGPDHTLAQRLQTSVEGWAAAGRPFVGWPLNTIGRLQLRACPVDVPYTPQGHEFVLKKRYTQFIFMFQSQESAQAVPPTARPVDEPQKGHEQHIDLLKLGKERWNQWRKQHPDIIPDLSAADLQNAVMKELDLRGARLNGANLSRADLFGSDLSGADLNGADLSEVRAANVNLSGADLSGADLHHAFLVKATLNGARLNGANLSEARLKGSSLAHADLRGATLVGTHLNRVNLRNANLNGVNLANVDLQDTYLPDTNLASTIIYGYRSNATSLDVAPQVEESHEALHFAVGNKPRVVLKDVRGTIQIRTWNKPGIDVIYAGASPHVRQEQDTIFISGGEDALEIVVPRIPHGIVRLVEHGRNTILTTISGEQLAGDVLIGGTGDIDLHDVGGLVSLEAVAGNVLLERLQEGAMLSRVSGNVQIKDALWSVMDSVEGNVNAERMRQSIHCAVVGGNCTIQESIQAVISIGHVAGNALLNGRVDELDCQIGGNAVLQATYSRRCHSFVKVGGNVRLHLEQDADLRVSITAGGQFKTREDGSNSNGHFAHRVYGSGCSSLDVVAGGDVYLAE